MTTQYLVTIGSLSESCNTKGAIGRGNLRGFSYLGLENLLRNGHCPNSVPSDLFGANCKSAFFNNQFCLRVNGMKKHQLTVSIPNTPEYRDFMGVIQQWSKEIPTLFFLDLCTISKIKKSLARDLSESPEESETLAELRYNDLPQNGFSYLPALMEKASDTKSNFDVEGLKEEAIRDLTAMRSFFKNANVYEPDEFVSNYVAELKEVHPEILGPKYHEFLNYINNLKIFNNIAVEKRFGAAKKICDEASRLGVTKGHPLILAALACVYGCSPAKKVLKFKNNPEEFSSSNALGDIQIIQRVGTLSQMVEESAQAGNAPYFRTKFVTHDKHLNDFYRYFFINEVISDEGEDSTENRYEMTVKADKLFPDLFGEDGFAKGESENEEVLKIYYLLGVSDKKDLN